MTETSEPMSVLPPAAAEPKAASSAAQANWTPSPTEEDLERAEDPPAPRPMTVGSLGSIISRVDSPSARRLEAAIKAIDELFFPDPPIRQTIEARVDLLKSLFEKIVFLNAPLMRVALPSAMNQPVPFYVMPIQYFTESGCERISGILKVIAAFYDQSLAVSETLPKLDEALTSELNDTYEKLRALEDPNEAARVALNFLTFARSNFSLLQSLHLARTSAEAAAQQAATAAVHAREAAGISAGSSAEFVLSEAYQEYGGDEKRAADAWRIVATACLVLLAGVAIWFLRGAAPASLESILRRAAAGTPILVLAGYAAREATSHRRNARWAMERGIQLRTVSAYVGRLPFESGKQILEVLGAEVFGPSTTSRSLDEHVPHSLQADESSSSFPIDPSLLENLKSILEKTTEALRTLGVK